MEELKNSEYNPVLLFKKQGMEQPEDMDNISDNDFLLCIQTEFQRDMLRKFGSKAICMDDTHGTNCYDFNLVTIVVVDEYGEGIPVGWMVSNRQDTLVLMEFLKAIKERAGIINPDWFMSDDAEQFFTAWRATFGEGGSTKKLLCAWHIDRAWRKALQENITNKEEQVEVYHQLRVLLMETEEARFRVTLQEFLTLIEKKHKKFQSYFFYNYCNRLQQWASCYRTQSTVNTNMFLEAFHRVLKIVYFHHKQNRRIDFLLTTLLKIARDMAFERFRKLEIGKATHRICEIHKRHKSAEQIQQKKTHKILTISPKLWKVESQSRPGTHYSVEKVQDSSCQCRLICNFCRVCAHQYSCTCIDGVLHSTVCKHVHLVVMSLGAETRTTQPNHIVDENNDYFSRVLTPGKNHTDVLNAKTKLNSLETQLHGLITNCEDIDALNTARTHVQAAITMLKALPNVQKRLPVKRKIAPNSNNEKQLQFFSTKKKRLSVTNRISKPSHAQANEQRTKLSEVEPKFCGVCLKESDSRSSTTIYWIQCSTCNMWIHKSCSAITSSLDSSVDYICD